MRIIVYIWPDIDIYAMWLFFSWKIMFYLVYMYYTHPSYQTFVGKNCAYYIRILMVVTAVSMSYCASDECWNGCRSSTEADEAVLCTLKVDCNGVLSIKPDFNKGRRAYKVGGGIEGRGLSLCGWDDVICFYLVERIYLLDCCR